MAIKQILFSAIIFNSIITSGLTAENNSHNRVLKNGYWNGINGKYFSSVLTNHTDPQDDLNDVPVVVKSRSGQLKLAGNLGEYRTSQEFKSAYYPRKTQKLFNAIINNYGVVCNNRFLIVHSDQVSDCEKVLTQFHNELRDAEEGIEFLENRRAERMEFLAAAEADATHSDNEKNQQ